MVCRKDRSLAMSPMPLKAPATRRPRSVPESIVGWFVLLLVATGDILGTISDKSSGGGRYFAIRSRAMSASLRLRRLAPGPTRCSCARLGERPSTFSP